MLNFRENILGQLKKSRSFLIANPFTKVKKFTYKQANRSKTLFNYIPNNVKNWIGLKFPIFYFIKNSYPISNLYDHFGKASFRIQIGKGVLKDWRKVVYCLYLRSCVRCIFFNLCLVLYFHQTNIFMIDFLSNNFYYLSKLLYYFIFNEIENLFQQNSLKNNEKHALIIHDITKKVET